MHKEFVRFIRQVFGLTQKEFSHRLGYSKIYINYIETGVKPVSKKFQDRVVKGFNLTDEDVVLYQTMYKKSNREEMKL